jgi:hypothetical protein
MGVFHKADSHDSGSQAYKQIIMGPLVIGKNIFKIDSCLHGAILNLTEIRSIWTLIEECSSIDTGAVKNNTAA